ncbi:mitochondrial nuclease [Grosmannia clavigera kw1407]|uniref:Endonuclease n=1 Tax=Grosmannia clavigera (strain kw1407 / UAMH 11150) TaxID=655863 RepID=F0XQ91_GROCL|nr:mitochondrial nuclease [Grosmannia clavigera kw1407]EFX00164.1 mitochondrial nuclease [Grosmannia clavigera kw1407]
MSKTTIAVIAAVSAGSGAAITAAMYSLRSGKPADLPATVPSVGSATTKVPGPMASQVRAPPLPPPAAAGARKAGADAPVDPAGLFQYGFPGPVSDLAVRSALVSAYDRRLRNPHWVAEHITAASLESREGDRQNSTFVEDEAMPEAFRARLRDYFRSGFDRGHQVPAADARWSQTAMDETFFLSNMCPQVGQGFNRDYWAHLEDFVRRLTARYPSVRVVTGPLYLPKRDETDGKWYVKYEMIGSPPNVAVPTHFYKVIYAETVAAGSPAADAAPVALGAFVLPNAPIPNSRPLIDFEVPLEIVERAAGLEFASKLPAYRRRRLCADTTCSLVVREFSDRQKQQKKK